MFLGAPHNRSFKNTQPKQDWRDGSDANRTLSSFPRYTMPAGGESTRMKTKEYVTGEPWRFTQKTNKWTPTLGKRDTYIDAFCRSTLWVPGAGQHRCGREFPISSAKDDADENCNKKIKNMNYTVPKQIRTASCSKFSDWVKKPYLRADIPSSFYAPGPGYYKLESTFGMPSGGERLKTYFGKCDETSGSRKKSKE